MKTGNLPRAAAALLASGGLVSVHAGAHAQETASLTLDTPQSVSGVEMVCTGIGAEARSDPRWSMYPLRVEVAGIGGQFLGDVQFALEKDGKVLAQSVCSGPWLLFKVSPGRYRISATTEGKTVSSTTDAPMSGQRRVILRFPELGGGTESSPPAAK